VGLCEISGIHVVKHNFLRSRVKIVILYIFCIFFSNLGTWQQARGKFHLFYKRVFNDKTNPGWRKQAVKTEGRPLQIPAQSTGGYGGQLTTTCGVAWILAVNLFHRSFPSTKVPISNSLCNCLVTKPWGGRRMPWAAKWSLTVSGAWIDEQPPVPFTFSSLQLVDEFIPVSMQHIKLLGIAVPNIISATRPCVSRIGSYWCINITDLPRIIPWVHNKRGGADALDKFSREETLCWLLLCQAVLRQNFTNILKLNNTMEDRPEKPFSW